MSYFSNEIKHFGNSFLIDNKFLYTFLFELMFVIIIAFAFTGWLSALTYYSDLVSQAHDGISSSESVDQITGFVGAFKVFLFYLIMLTSAFLAVFLFAWAMSRTLIWGKLTNKKIHLKFYFKFALLKLVWQIFWLPLTAILVFIIYAFSSALQTNPYIALYYFIAMIFDAIVFLIIAYFGLFMYKSFFEHQKIYHSITEAFKNGARKFIRMFVPITLSLSAFIILWVVLFLLNKAGIYYFYINLFMFLYVFNATRRYMIERVNIV